MNYNEPLPGACEGCGENDLTVRRHLARFTDDPEKWIEVFYCNSCALLAEVNWNGETLEIEYAEHEGAG